MPLARYHFGVMRNGRYIRSNGPGLPDLDMALQAALLHIQRLPDVSIVAIECVREPELLGAFDKTAVTLDDFIRLTPDEAHLLIAGQLPQLPNRKGPPATPEQKHARDTSVVEFEAMLRDRQDYIKSYAYNRFLDGRPLSVCIEQAEDAAKLVFDDIKKEVVQR